MAKVTREQADTEVQNWLDYKKVFQETREKYKEHIEILAEAIMNGVLTLEADFKFKHTLLFPLGGDNNETGLAEVTYQARINDKQLLPYMKGVKSDDVDMRLLALVAALAKEPKNIMISLDSQDKRIAMAVGIFFI